MRPATSPPERRDGVRLLAVDPSRRAFFDGAVTELPELLRLGDLVVVNDAATLPGSLRGTVHDAAVEVRLIGPPAPSVELFGARNAQGDGQLWAVVLFGRGDWRTPTERRMAPPVVRAGDRIVFGEALAATVLAVSAVSPRLLGVRFDRAGAALWRAFYAVGAPVQYAYQQRPIDLWSVQTVYGARPWAAEMPSAGRPLTWASLLALRRRDIAVESLTHAAGLSATGDDQLDAALPLPERYDIPARTVDAITTARARGGRVIAVGTSVVRALEGSARSHGAVRAGEGATDLLIDRGFVPQVCDGILTGMHNQDESHYRLLGAFADRGTLTASWHHALDTEYRCHEFGDVSLLLPHLLKPRHRTWISSSAMVSKAAPTGASTRPFATPASTSPPLTSAA